MKQIAYGRVRRKMEGGCMEGTSKVQIHGVSPQGIIKILFLVLTILANADGEKTMAHTTYSVAVETVNGFQVYYIQQDGKAVAEIVPALGNNCYAFRVADGDT